MKKVLGFTLLVLAFSAITLMMAYGLGLKLTLLVFGITAVLSGAVVGGVYLITSEKS